VDSAWLLGYVAPVSGGARLGLNAVAAMVGATLTLLAPGFAPAASAAQFGSECPATLRSTAGTVMQISRAGAPISTSGPGVVTSWAVNNPSYEGVMEELKIFQPIGPEFEVVAGSALQAVPKGGLSKFDVRIPVAAGVQFGVYDPVGAPECYNTFTSEDKYGHYAGDVPVKGKIKSFDYVSEKTLIALAVTVEPDADGDGFGDQTQDGCPTNAAAQGACPTTAPGTGGGGSPGGGATPSVPTTTAPTVGITSATLEGNTVAVKLSAGAQAQVTVSGLIKGKPAAVATTVAVTPGAVGRAYLTLSKATRERLAKLPAKGHLTLVIEAQTAGAVPASRELPLRGRKKPHRKHHSA
jgi:hypothetical protein